jgi:mannosylglucosylglycerate synthase
MAEMKTVLIHYNVAPVAGGVERVMTEHAKLFGMYGDVVVLFGNGSENAFEDHSNLAAVRLEEIDLNSRKLQAAMEDPAGEDFRTLKCHLKERLRDFCEDANFVVGHNVFTMPFHLPLTMALAELAQELTAVRFVAWVHDVGIAHPNLQVPESAEWDVLRHAVPGVQYVAVSERRKQDVMEKLGATECRVVPNGLDVVDFLGLSMEVAELAGSWEFFSADLVLLCPARILRRKNLELAIRTVAALTQLEQDVRLVITGAPDHYNPDSEAYGKHLRALCTELRLDERVCFVHDFFKPCDEDIRCLYQISDALFFPSRHEGFGLPLLEAAATRTPIFCAEIEPLQSIFFTPVHSFSPCAAPEQIADLLLTVLAADFASRRFREVLRRYECFTLFKNIVEPMLGLGEIYRGHQRNS